MFYYPNGELYIYIYAIFVQWSNTRTTEGKAAANAAGTGLEEWM